MKHKLSKRILSILLAMVVLVGLLPTAAIPVFAEGEQPTVDSEGYTLIWSYDQLRSVAQSANFGKRYRLATDIYQEDSENDQQIWVQSGCFSLDLNGHVLSRKARSLDSSLFIVQDRTTLELSDSSPEQTGTCIYDIIGSPDACSVIYNRGGSVIINSGRYIIKAQNTSNTATVLYGTSGEITVYGGYFDSTEAKGGSAVELRLTNDLYEMPTCVIHGGEFYSQRTCIKSSSLSNYANIGAYYPYVFVLGGEFYTKRYTGDEYEGKFAYCSNFWGRVIVADGLVLAKSLNMKDQRYATGTTKTVETLTGEPGNGWSYATVSPPPLIVANQMPLEDRLYSLCFRDYLKAAKENESYDYWTKYQAEIEAELAKIDGFSVNIFDTEVVLSIEDKEEIDSVRWYVSASPDSDWTELVDYQNSTGPITQDPPKQVETVYYRAVVTHKDGTEYEDIIYVNCEEPEKGSAYDENRLTFKVTPEGEGDAIDLARTVKESETFEMSWKVPSYMGEGVVCQPEITVTRPNSNIAPKTYSDSKVTLDYSDYPNDVIVNCRLYALIDGSVVYFEKSYNVDVKRVYTATDGCIRCYAAGEDGWDEIEEGGSCSFKLYPNDYYELTDPDALEVYVNDVLVTPDANGVYTVENVTEDLDIYCDGSGFTSYSNLTITANGTTVKEKIFDGGTYTFKTLDEFGATVPSGSTFTGWKLGGKTYQPGDTYTVVGTADIKVNAAFTGLYNITVEGGTAYADEAHTQPITHAAEEQVIYIVADPAPEGKVFSYWTETDVASPGGDGWFGGNNAAQTTYTVYKSDVVLAPVYETLVDNIVINGMTKPVAGVAIKNVDYNYKWGCSVPADSGYRLATCYWYDITDADPVKMNDGAVFKIGNTYRFEADIRLNDGTCFPQNAEDISVALSGFDAEDYKWTINEFSYKYGTAMIYFEFTCEREEPDTALIRPEGDGIEGNPFQITNIGELYWFAAFVNGTASYPDGVTVEREEACAIVMNDITVNPGVLTEDGALNGPSGFAQWTPIGLNAGYDGTFDGNEKTISGIYCAPQDATKTYYGFFSHIDAGCVRNLTLEDSYFCAPAKNTAYTGGIAGQVYYNSTVENCHFDGTVTTAITGDSENKENYTYLEIAGIAGYVLGEVRDCTVRGLISGYGRLVGGIAAYVNYGEVSGCVNEATVENTRSDTGYYYTGGIAAAIDQGTVRDCCNKSNVSSGWISAGIVCHVEDKGSTVSRCWNEGEIKNGSGIVCLLNGTVQNCYNTGKVEYGIVGQPNSGSSITYCHNVGEITSYGSPIWGVSSGNFEIADCYYMADSETDEHDGTTYKTAAEFADGTVLALLDNGNWEQGDDYPVLAKAKGVTVSGTVTSFGSETDNVIVQLIAEGYSEADYEVFVQGNTAAYSIEGVAVGTYTLRVVKNNHVAREYTIVVGTDDVSQDAKICLLGDVTGDGRVNVADTGKVYAHVKQTALLTDEYVLACADVTGDGRINVADTGRIYAHVRQTSLLW